MTTRRGPRPTHVRPRPPSSGRPAPVKVRPRAPQPSRVASHRPIARGRGMPIVLRIALALAVVALGAVVLYVGAGGLGGVATSLGKTLLRVRRRGHRYPVALADARDDLGCADARAAGGALHERQHRRSRRERAVGAGRRHRAPHPRLPLAQGPAAAGDPGGADRRQPQDGHPGRADQGHQRFHGHDHRATAASRTPRPSFATC